MHGIVAAAIALASIGTAHSQGLVEARLFECMVKTKATLQDDGGLGPTDWTDLNKKAFSAFTFDEASQVLRWKGSGNAWQYRMAQRGTSDSDLVAIRTMQGTAAFVVDTLRIRTWEPDWPFLLVEQDEVTTGVCRRF